MYMQLCSTLYLTCSLRSLVRYQVEHEKKNSIATCTHALSSVYYRHLSLTTFNIFALSYIFNKNYCIKKKGFSNLWCSQASCLILCQLIWLYIYLQSTGKSWFTCTLDTTFQLSYLLVTTTTTVMCTQPEVIFFMSCLYIYLLSCIRKCKITTFPHGLSPNSIAIILLHLAQSSSFMLLHEVAITSHQLILHWASLPSDPSPAILMVPVQMALRLFGIHCVISSALSFIKDIQHPSHCIHHSGKILCNDSLEKNSRVYYHDNWYTVGAAR